MKDNFNTISPPGTYSGINHRMSIALLSQISVEFLYPSTIHVFHDLWPGPLGEHKVIERLLGQQELFWDQIRAGIHNGVQL